MTQLMYFSLLMLMMSGLLVVVVHRNKFKRLFGLTIFQNSILLFYIVVGFVDSGSIPIHDDFNQLYADPVPQVLMLTAIVVGVATFAVGLALIVKDKRL